MLSIEMNYETNCWQRRGNFLTFLLIAIATLTSLTARTLASVSSVMMVTSYTPLFLMEMESRSSVDQMVWLCVVCMCVIQSSKDAKLWNLPYKGRLFSS